MNSNTEIVEGNKLICEFTEEWGYRKPDLSRAYKGDYYLHKDHQYILNDFELKYHSSWDWLMPVVEKISDIKCIWDNAEPTIQDTYYPRTFGMKNSKTLNPMVRLNSCQIFEAKTLIEATWLAVVDFITWYNQGKEDERVK